MQDGAIRLAVPLGLLRLMFWSLTHPGKKAHFWDVVAASGKDLPQYRDNLAAVFEMLRTGEIKPTISESMPLKEAPKAQQMLLDYEAQGKIILVSG